MSFISFTCFCSSFTSSFTKFYKFYNVLYVFHTEPAPWATLGPIPWPAGASLAQTVAAMSETTEPDMQWPRRKRSKSASSLQCVVPLVVVIAIVVMLLVYPLHFPNYSPPRRVAHASSVLAGCGTGPHTGYHMWATNIALHSLFPHPLSYKAGPHIGDRRWTIKIDHLSLPSPPLFNVELRSTCTAVVLPQH